MRFGLLTFMRCRRLEAGEGILGQRVAEVVGEGR
jgi:hypothetical protein